PEASMRTWFTRRRTLSVLGIVVIAALGVAWQLPAPQALSPADEGNGTRPRLAVLLVFDQMRGDYLQKWRPLFGEGGFKRLQEEGAWFTNCHYPYAYTITAPGHASLSTGATPARHGIVSNDWYDRGAGQSVTA